MATLLFITFLLTVLIKLAEAAALSGSTTSNHLSPRQIVEAGSTVQCCTNCEGRYTSAQFEATFNDLCTWAGNGLELVSTQQYATKNYYCPWSQDPSECMHLEIQFNCWGSDGNEETAKVSYEGCMGYFEFCIDPASTCGGSPYPGCRVTSADKCWVFQATADKNSASSADAELADLSLDATGNSLDAAGHFCTSNCTSAHDYTFGRGTFTS